MFTHGHVRSGIRQFRLSLSPSSSYAPGIAIMCKWGGAERQREAQAAERQLATNCGLTAQLTGAARAPLASPLCRRVESFNSAADLPPAGSDVRLGPSPPLPTPSRLAQLMQHPRQTLLAQEVWAQVVRPGDTVVDATCGNGHDAAYLAQAVGPTGRLFVFDVQPTAMAATQAEIEAALPLEARPRVEYVQGCHSGMAAAAGIRTASLVCFNLGYLPGSDKAVTTNALSTLAAVEAACEVLAPGGLLSLLCYSGHQGGREEYEAVQQAVGQLAPAAWGTFELRLPNRPAAPVLILAWKRSSQPG